MAKSKARQQSDHRKPSLHTHRRMEAMRHNNQEVNESGPEFTNSSERLTPVALNPRCGSCYPNLFAGYDRPSIRAFPPWKLKRTGAKAYWQPYSRPYPYHRSPDWPAYLHSPHHLSLLKRNDFIGIKFLGFVPSSFPRYSQGWHTPEIFPQPAIPLTRLVDLIRIRFSVIFFSSFIKIFPV